MSAPNRRLLVYGIAGGVALAILIAASSLSSNKDSLISSPNVIGSNSTSLPENSANATQLAGERSWLAVTSVDDAANIQYDDGTLPLQRPTSYNSDAPRTTVDPEIFSKIPSLKNAFAGADGCRGGTEVCEVSYGFSEGGDKDNYELSIPKEQALAIRKEIPLAANTNDTLLAFGDKLYWMVLYTSNDFRVLQMRSEFVEQVPIEPIPLQSGESLQYTVLVKTWATFGAPAEMKLYTQPSSSDSGVSVRVEPDSLILTERSEQKVKLIITPTEKAKDGIYDIRIWGKFDCTPYSWPDNPCQHSACPSVQVGDSFWHIGSYGGGAGLGGNAPPEWLKLKLTTDKEVYRLGETVKFTAYLENAGMDSLAYSEARLIVNIYPSEKNFMNNVFNIDAWHRDDAGADEIVIPPGSTVLARQFDWDQKMLNDGILTTDHVDDGKYTIDAALLLSPGGYVLYDEKELIVNPK